MKEFLSINQQFELLKSRGLIIDESAKEILAKENYYSLINGYKDYFLDKELMKQNPDDKYLKGASFNNIYSLFLFDRDLRNITFKYLLIAEGLLKTAVAYVFCDSYKEPESYRDINNFTDWENMLVPKSFKSDLRSNYYKNIHYLQYRFDQKLNDRKINKNYILHYLRNHEFVPLWVLVNDLTFGNISNFYQLMKRREQDSMCKFLKTYNISSKNLNPRKLLRVFNLLVYFRNLCAHDERLFCAKYSNDSFKDMLSSMKQVISPDLFDFYIKEITNLVNDYCPKIKFIDSKKMKVLLGLDKLILK